jgi:hypothetical protein
MRHPLDDVGVSTVHHARWWVMTMPKLARLVTVVLLAAGVRGGSADTAPATPAALPTVSYARLQYVGGDPGLPEKAKGTLVVQPHELRFLDNRKQPIFTRAIGERTWASRSEGREKTAGRIVLLVLTFPFWGAGMGMGIEPPSFHETTYFVNVQSEGSHDVRFKCAPKSRCDAIINRINSYAAAAKTPQ